MPVEEGAPEPPRFEVTVCDGEWTIGSSAELQEVRWKREVDRETELAALATMFQRLNPSGTFVVDAGGKDTRLEDIARSPPSCVSCAKPRRSGSRARGLVPPSPDDSDARRRRARSR